jgi:Family of unknown function (DUF6221)
MDELADFVDARLDEQERLWTMLARAARGPLLGPLLRRVTAASSPAGLAAAALDDIRVKRLIMADHRRGDRIQPDGHTEQACTVCDPTQWDGYGNCHTARHLAELFRGHPGYRSWQPGRPGPRMTGPAPV